MKGHHFGVIIVGILIVIFGVFVFSTNQTSNISDELTGTWSAGGTNAAGLDWYMLYIFDNGEYTFETGTDYGEEGTYRIINSYEDGSLIVEKTFYGGEKIYEMAVRLDEDEPDALYIEGLKLDRVK